MPLSDPEFRQLVKDLEYPLRDRSHRERIPGMAFPNDPAKRNYAMDTLDPKDFALKIVQRYYHKDRSSPDLIVLLQVIQEDDGGDLGTALQPYLDMLNATMGSTLPIPMTQPPVTRKQLNAQEYFERGNVRRKIGDPDGAIAEYTEAIRLDPEFADAWYNRGRAYEEKPDYDKAITDFNEALFLNPKDTRTYLSRGKARKEKGDYDGAIADYVQAFSLQPGVARTVR